MKKLDKRECILYNFIDIKFYTVQTLQQWFSVNGAGVMDENELGLKKFWEVMEMFGILIDCGDSFTDV